MKALGVLVGGVAHEVNTPIGLAYTAVTHAFDQLSLIREKLLAGASPTDEGLARCLRQMGEGLGYASDNLQKVAQLIEGFKQVAVDQTFDMRRGFDLGPYLGEIVSNLKPKPRKGGREVRIHIPEPIFLGSIPGALSQIITNTVVHGFDDRSGGTVRIDAKMEGSSVCCLSIEDDGKGMPPSVTRRVFEPFFTTRRGEGGSGTRFILRIPLSAGVGFPEQAAYGTRDAGAPSQERISE